MMIVLLILMVWGALQTVRASHLLSATLWLAAVSVLIATMLYDLGAWQIAVIELSVGSGLVTVLMVFVITIVGNEPENIDKRRLPVLVIIMSILLLVILTVPFIPPQAAGEQQSLSNTLWQERGLDLVLQAVLIFAGVLGVIGLLSAAKGANSILKDFPVIQSTSIVPEQTSYITEKEVA
jgi:NADH:ubiquinone oxidoreductase subunit 6 (subunit J)